MVFVSVLHINQFTELSINGNGVAPEYFNDLVSRKLAFQTNKDLIVYKFDHSYTGGGVIDVFIVKLQNETIVELIDTTAGTISSVKSQAGSILGWVFGHNLKKNKCK